MDGLLVTLSGIYTFVAALIILDAIARRRYKALVFFTSTTIYSGVICYIIIAELPHFQGHPWYWKAAVPVSMFLFGVIGALTVSTAKHKGK